MRRRPRSLPRYWRSLQDAGVPVYPRIRESLLVLEACGIPCRSVRLNGRCLLYVPPLLEMAARRELEEFWHERRSGSSTAPPPLPCTAGQAALPLVALLLLSLWHGWRVGWWSPPAMLPPPGSWAAAGMLDSIRVAFFHEWYRLICSLTLHADVAHLCGNMVFGAIFLMLLGKLCGPGRALWLSLLGGTAGNGLSLLLRHRPVASMGFSTALFAAAGCLAGFMAGQARHRREAIMALAAGLALLAMLGTEGERTDYAAHVCGLASGMALGALEAWRQHRGWPAMGQTTAALASALLTVSAWWLAFHTAQAAK